VGQGRRRIIWALAAAICGAAATAPAGASNLAPLRPVFAHTVVLTPISGKVSILVPGARYGFVRLYNRPTLVPVGTIVDTTAGRVRLTSANPPNPNPSPARQSGQFFRGIFRIQQDRTQGGLVNLVISDNLSPSVCAPPGSARSAAANPRILGLLRGTAKGRFRTTGRFAAASVRGTDWGVRDRCDGTLTVVRTGVVAVRDFRLHKTVIVRAGQTYLAKAR
jgi:hypothetical protein